MEKPKLCNEGRNLIRPNKQADTATHVTVVNHVNIGSDHRMVISNIKLYIEVERNKLMTKRPIRVDAAQKNDRIEKLIPYTTITRPHRHH